MKTTDSMPWRAIGAMLALLFALAGCDGSVFVSGRVVDESGQPLEGVSLTLANEAGTLDFAATSGEQGCFLVGGVVAPGQADFLLAVSLADHRSLQDRFPAQEPYEVLITLAPAAGDRESQVERLAAEAAETVLGDCPSQP